MTLQISAIFIHTIINFFAFYSFASPINVSLHMRVRLNISRKQINLFFLTKQKWLHVLFYGK